MPEVPFTQFMRPNGRSKPVLIDRPDKIARKAKILIESGHRFECEELMTGLVSLTVVYDGENIDIEVVSNGPEVPKAVDRLIERAVVKKPADAP